MTPEANDKALEKRLARIAAQAAKAVKEADEWLKNELYGAPKTPKAATEKRVSKDTGVRMRCSECRTFWADKSEQKCRCACHARVPELPRKDGIAFNEPSYFLRTFGDEVRAAGGKAFRHLI